MAQLQKNLQPTLFHFLEDDRLVVIHRNTPYSYIQKQSLLTLHRNLGIKRGVRDGTIDRIKNNKQRTISFHDLWRIFEDDWIFLLAEPYKIERDFSGLNPDVSVFGGTLRGENRLPVKKLRKYVTINILGEDVPNIPEVSENAVRDATVMRDFLGFDVQEYRSLYRPNDRSAFKYLTEKIDKKSIYVFNAYDMHRVMPMDIGDERFDGMTVTTEEGNCAVCISSKCCPERRGTTCIALLRSLMPNTKTRREKDSLFLNLSQNREPLDLQHEHYEFVGHFLLHPEEIHVLRMKKFNSWGQLKEEARKVGVSASFLHNFLFFNHNKIMWRFLYSQRPKGYSENKNGGGGPGWTFNQAFREFYSPKLCAVKMRRIGNDTSVYNQTARTMIAKGGKKEKQNAFREIIDTNI